MSSLQTRPMRRCAALLAAAAATLAAAGCDNPACVFGGDCSGGGGGGLGANAAAAPSDHVWLLPGAPEITGFFPEGGPIHSATPIVITFSESMAASTLARSVQVLEVGGFAPLPTLPPALLGDGRMLVVLPIAPLTAGAEIEVGFAQDSIVTDLTGVALLRPPQGLIGSFTVADTDPVAPRVLASWPPELSQNQSTTGEIVVVFDREIDSATVTSSSFVVTVDGLPPAFDPPPQALLVLGPGGPLTDTRVYRWRSADGEGQAAHLPPGGEVEVLLSPSGQRILGEDGGVLPQTTISFDLLTFTAPLSAEIVSVPTDAIGIDNLTAARPLEVAVELSGAQTSDFLGAFLFGTAPDGSQLIALFREARIADIPFDPGTGIATLGEAQLDIAGSSSPVQARFADGGLAIALRVRRGTTVSPVKLVDTDLDAAGPQDPLLDVTRPTLSGFGASGTNTSSFRSDLRGLALVGRASEELRSVEVATALGDNGMLPPVVGSSEEGLFVAAPVDLSLIDPAQLPLAFTAAIYDRALNRASADASGTFDQLGAVGPGAALPGAATVDVRVFDARTLAAVSGALVFSHRDAGGPVTFVDVLATAADGRASVMAAASGETLVTVDAAGYDLFTLHGVPTSRLDVPLSRTLEAPGRLSGTVIALDPAFTPLDRFVADSRLLEADVPVVTVQSCSFDPTSGFECNFGPRFIRPGEVGVLGLAAVSFPGSEFNYVARAFLRAWELERPIAPAAPSQTVDVEMRVGTLLDAAGVDTEEQVLDGPVVDLSAVGIAGLDLGALSGRPQVQVQAQVRGMSGAGLAGFGVAFDQAGAPTDRWRVRSALPGAVDPTSGKYPGDEVGELVADGVVDPDLFLRCEIRDTAGSHSVRRPRFSTLGASLALASAPQVVAPPAGGNTGGPSFDLTFTDVLPDALGQVGLYRATLVAANGRRWVLWRADAPDGAGGMGRVHLPDIAANGGAPLANGMLAASVAAFAWPTLDPALFAWTDLGREHDVLAEATPVVFAQP